MKENKNYFIQRYKQVFSIFLIQVVILFASAGTWRWFWGLCYIGLSLLIMVINSMVIPREVIEERAKKKENVKTWDKVINSLNIIPTLGLFVIVGLDHRYQWTGEMTTTIHVIGMLVLFSGAMLFTWSMTANKFFSTLARIQDDRDHEVATGGPYKYVRHPGYLGYMGMSVGTPIFLGSIYGLICSAITVVLFIVRTSLEDSMLNEELDGYRAYAKKVRYKLLPFIW